MVEPLILTQLCINVDFAKLIFDHSDVLPAPFPQEVVEKSGLMAKRR